jgi:hypothetical protein
VLKIVAAVVACLLVLPFIVRFDGADGLRPGQVERPPDIPPLQVDNDAVSNEDEIEQAIADLKAIEFWDDLTNDLYIVQIQTRPLDDQIPDDRHVADAVLQARADEGGKGVACVIRFFVPPMMSSLENMDEAFERGLIPRVPTVRQFWAQVFAHELAHCIGGGQPEDVAQLWEWTTLERLVEEGIE